MSEELAPAKVVEVTDDETGERIPMQVYVELEIDGRLYALLIPEAPVVNILRLEKGEEDEIFDLPPESFAQLKKDINAALKDYGVEVKYAHGEYLLVGDPAEALYTDCGELTLDEDEEYWVLAEIDDGEAVYLVCQPLSLDITPVELGEGDAPRLLSDEELESLQDVFESALADDLPEAEA